MQKGRKTLGRNEKRRASISRRLALTSGGYFPRKILRLPVRKRHREHGGLEMTRLTWEIAW
jgi:hypothetical protein